MTPGTERLLDMTVIVVGKTLGWAIVAWGPVAEVRELVRDVRRRRRRRSPEELQRTAELESTWAEIQREAHARTPERADPDPHVLKLSRVPAP
jgi:hypothetical protein